jgi:hypothetical protein
MMMRTLLRCLVNSYLRDADDIGVQHANKEACIIPPGRLFPIDHNELLFYFCFDSTIQFLVNEYKADPNTFLYDWKYDTSDKHSVMSQVYIDLGNYLAGKKIHSLFVLI